jgi:predicted ATPase with chaperone activity
MAPRPTELRDLGVGKELLADLLSKHLLRAGRLRAGALAERLALPGTVLQELLHNLRREGRIEVHAGSATDTELAYVLSERGRHLAREALHRDGYVGPAPVPLNDYVRIVHQQTLRRAPFQRSAMHTAFSDVILDSDLIDKLGTAMGSGRAILLHGPAGSGKTFAARRLERAMHGTVLVPYALLVNDSIIRLFDPLIHECIDLVDGTSPLVLDAGVDPRYACCERPVVYVGGELVSSMLEVEHHETTRELLAPLQLKANNGLLIIDDLGRQRVPAAQLLNRCIVPMEQHLDSFSIGGGSGFTAPFDAVLVFATNLAPSDIADEALLRRLGYKIAFGPVSPEQYRHIWEQVCVANDLLFDRTLVDFVLEELYPSHQLLMPCHPRDLLGLVADKRRYDGSSAIPDRELVRWAWDTYFPRMR